MTILLHPAKPMPKQARAWPLAIVIPLLALLWWVLDLHQCATVKWMHLDHEGGISASKQFQLSLLAVVAVALVVASLLLGWNLAVTLVAGAAYIIITAIRWV